MYPTEFAIRNLFKKKMKKVIFIAYKIINIYMFK